MKQMIGKSIGQSMTIDALLVNWHWPISNHTKVVATHRLSLKNLRIPHVPARMYTHSQYAQMFEIWIRSPDCLYAVAWFQKSATETQVVFFCFEETQVKNTPFRLVFLRCLYTVDVGFMWIGIEGLRAKRAYIEFWPIFIFCRIELIFGRLTCFDMKSIVP